MKSLGECTRSLRFYSLAVDFVRSSVATESSGNGIKQGFLSMVKSLTSWSHTDGE